MPDFKIGIPFDGIYFITVTAETQEEAIDAALNSDYNELCGICSKTHKINGLDLDSNNFVIEKSS